jgi:hypothetical protein
VSSPAKTAYIEFVPDNEKLRTLRCECGAADCTSELLMSWEEQDAVDHDGRNLFAVAPGHEFVGPEEIAVISSNERFSVVEVKVGLGE